MAQDNSSPIDPSDSPMETPHPALKRLEKLIGKWELRGRTLNAPEDNITGTNTIQWMPGGFFLLVHGEMEFQGFKFQSLEILNYDPATDTFPSTVYSSMEGKPLSYWWNVQGDVVTHWTQGSKYTGTFSQDGNTLVGGWRPDAGEEQHAGNTYDATMIRIK